MKDNRHEIFLKNTLLIIMSGLGSRHLCFNITEKGHMIVPG